MKKILLPAAIALVVSLSVVHVSCSKTEEVAQNAAKDWCDCFRDGKSQSDCEDKINTKYKNSINNEFIKAFNDAQDCGRPIEKK